MTRHTKPDPWQEEYERWKAAGFPEQQPRAPQPRAPQPTAPGAQQPTGASAGQAASPFAKQGTGSGITIAPRTMIVAAVIGLIVIVTIIIGHAIASSNSIAVGDCVVTNPDALTGWDIKKVTCGSNPGSAFEVQQVQSVQDGSDGECGFGLTTFQDDPNNQTYCLTLYSFGG